MLYRFFLDTAASHRRMRYSRRVMRGPVFSGPCTRGLEVAAGNEDGDASLEGGRLQPLWCGDATQRLYASLAGL